MAVYIFSFTISGLLFFLSEKVVVKQRKMVALCALIVPCLIAGLRSSTIGTDIKTYLLPMTKAALNAGSFEEYWNTSWWWLYKYIGVSEYELGFGITVYIIAHIFGSIHAVQFVIQALTIVPIYLACKKLQKIRNFPVWLFMLVYFSLMFNMSLNLMRQSIGVSFILLAYSYLVNNERKKCVILTMVATFFHISSLLGIVVFLVHEYANSNIKSHCKSYQSYYPKMLIIIFGGLSVIVGVGIVADLLSTVGLGRYVSYISGQLEFLPNQLIVRVPVFALLLFSWRILKDKFDGIFLFSMLWFDLVCSQFASTSSFGGRISICFMVFELITMPSIYVASKRNKLILAIIITYLGFYWWYYYVFIGKGMTVPYVLGT